MLSNPRLELSAGSSVDASTSSESRSRIALAYSARFMRCSGTRPGPGDAAAARSMAVSIALANASSVARAGLGIPAGGISPARTLRMTFSQISASASTRSSETVSSARPPVCVRELWQVMQVLLQ